MRKQLHEAHMPTALTARGRRVAQACGCAQAHLDVALCKDDPADLLLVNSAEHVQQVVMLCQRRLADVGEYGGRL